MSNLLPQSICLAGHLIYVLICQLLPVVLSPLESSLFSSLVAFPIPMGGTAKHKPTLYCIAACIRSQQQSLADPISVLKINWVLLNAILNKMLIKIRLLCKGPLISWVIRAPNTAGKKKPLQCRRDLPLELLSTKLHLEKASLLKKKRNLKTFIIRCANFITQNGSLKIKCF